MEISRIFNLVLEITIISSIIGLIIILLRQLLIKRVNSKWIYIIWFILLFKLLVPIKIESFVSVFNFIPKYITNNSYIENSKIEYENIQKQYASYINVNSKEQNEVVNIDLNNHEFDEIEQKYNNYKMKNIIFEYVVPIIWFFGFIIMLLWLIITNVVLNLKLNKYNCDDRRLEKNLEKCKVKMNVKRKFHIVVNDVISTPALFGILKVKILIPKEILKISDENLEYILLHELSHYKRKDILINYILLIIQSIHWFNPIIWLCFKLLRNDLELATDEYTLKYLEDSKYKSYANALIETLNVATNSKFSPRLVGMIDNKKNIKRRIIMIKSLEIFKKKKVIITIICIVLIIAFSLILLTSPITSDTPSDSFYIFSVSEENKIHRGAYKWKYLFGEVIADGIDPLEYARTINKVKCKVFEKIKIIDEDNNLQDIKQIDVLELENNINVLSINDFSNISKVEFVSPNSIGTYYYLMKVYYKNKSYVEYIFSIEVVQDENIVKDTSKKIAKLLTDVKWSFETLNYNGNIVSEISQQQIDNIDKIFNRGEEFLGTVSFASNPEYVIEFDEGIRKSIEIRILNDATISMKDNNKTQNLRTIYAEEDVNYILNLIGQKNKYASLPIINLDEYKSPIDIYWYGGKKFELGTYSWKVSTSNDLSSLVNSDAILPQELLKDKEAVAWSGILGTSVTIYSKDEGATKKLPEQTEVKYKIYEFNKTGDNIEYNTATRMNDGSYYLSGLPRTRGEYVVEIYVSFGKLSNNNAHYYIKINS